MSVKLSSVVQKLQAELSIYGDELYLISFINSLRAERASNVIYPELVRRIELDFRNTDEIILPKDYLFYVMPAFIKDKIPLFLTSNYRFQLANPFIVGTIETLPTGESVARVTSRTDKPCVMYFYSKHLFRFPLWKPNQSVSINQHIFHDWRYYKCVGSGTTGTLPPTHTQGIETNGSCQLEYLDRVFDFYDFTLFDQIELLYPEEICELLMTIYIKRKRGLDFEHEYKQYQNAKSLYAGRTNKMTTFNLMTKRPTPNV